MEKESNNVVEKTQTTYSHNIEECKFLKEVISRNIENIKDESFSLLNTIRTLIDNSQLIKSKDFINDHLISLSFNFKRVAIAYLKTYKYLDGNIKKLNEEDVISNLRKERIKINKNYRQLQITLYTIIDNPETTQNEKNILIKILLKRFENEFNKIIKYFENLKNFENKEQSNTTNITNTKLINIYENLKKSSTDPLFRNQRYDKKLPRSNSQVYLTEDSRFNFISGMYK